MRSRTAMIGTLTLFTLAGLAAAQYGQPMPAPAPQLPPLLYLRLAGPAGMKVTLFRGEPTGLTFDTPCIVGVRPGYTYRLALSNIAGFPGATFSPTLEVRGSLALTQQLRNADFPATVIFRTEEFAKVEQGGFVKKIVVLEHPESAEPTAARPNEPLELPVPMGRDLNQEVEAHGAPLAVVYLGQRALTPQELAYAAIPGTMLVPGEKALPMPRVAPWVPWACYPVHDPLHGPRRASDYLTIYDGGDSGLRAGFDREGRLRGLDPSDTIAEYVDAQGRPRLVASNRVALCVPRFVIMKTETGLVSQTSALATGSAHVQIGGAVLNNRQAFGEHTQPLHLETAANRLKLSGTEFIAGTAITGRANGVEMTMTLRTTGTLDSSCPPPTTPTLDRPLRIIKWPDKKGCIVGDVVRFSLQYTNQGSQPITNLAVTDSLTTRLEYVTGSQKADREANFTVQPNEAGSNLLRWEFPGVLPPGESGLITFQVRVR